MFGDSDSLKAVFDRAVHATDSLKMHKKMAQILAHHKRTEQLDELFENMIRKFRHEDLDVWYQYGNYLYESGRLEDARQLLQKATDSLARKHRKSFMISYNKHFLFRFADIVSFCSNGIPTW
jgi:Tfp pilus assembly protein PilF